MADVLTLSEAGSPQTVKVHPLVLFSILDHYTRRPETQDDGRVIGTLLGSVTEMPGGRQTIEIVNSFAVPHSEKGDEVAVGQIYNKTMFALHQRVNKREQVVGWYATSSNGVSIVDSSSLIHEFYSHECENPVHLTVDTSLTGDTIAVRGFVSAPLQIGGVDLANAFEQLKVTVESNEAERICIDKMLATDEADPADEEGEDGEGGQTSGLGLASVSVSSDADAHALEHSMMRLLQMLETASSFVDGVVDGEIKADDALGRHIADALAVVPRIRPEVFDRIFNGQLQDLLMVSYLSKVTQMQLSIAAKLNATMV